MNDSILERLKTLIAACPHLEKAKVYTDFVREDEICCGIFPVGEKRLSTDWAGNERWQYLPFRSGNEWKMQPLRNGSAGG